MSLLRVGDNIYKGALANTGGRRNMWRKPVSKHHVPRIRIRHGHTYTEQMTESMSALSALYEILLVNYFFASI